MSLSKISRLGIAIQFFSITLALLFHAFDVHRSFYIGVATSLALTGILFFKVLENIRISQLAIAISVWSIALVIFLQAAGFLWFPGLVKDLKLFSKEHLFTAILLFTCISIFFCFQAVIISTILRVKYRDRL